MGPDLNAPPSGEEDFLVWLDDNDEGIVIVKSGAPEPAPEMLDWLLTHCAGRWSYTVDNVFNVRFGFESAEDAERFKQRWKPS
jgi:hypothetical protein